uniref:Ketoreductase domain-containing protein n=1 Tax=Rhizophora mucronata TaxID=61149 RepID=A0A2P2IXP1_RHIMU
MDSKVTAQLEPWRDLRDKVVLITGASSGIGSDICLDLAKAGCRIVAAARRVDRLESLCEEINRRTFSSSSTLSPSSSSAAAAATRAVAADKRAVAVELDVSADGPAIEVSVQKAWDAFGRIDALINNAGVRGSVRTTLDLSEEEWNHVIRTNLTGSWLVSKYVCMRMRETEHGGSVINISSIAGLQRGQLPGGVAYASSKTGLNSLTKVVI